MINPLFEKNIKLFSEFKSLNLPLGQYAITNSGVLGIRNLREMGDIDIIVDAKLWEELAAKYGVENEGGIKKISLANGRIEVFGEHVFNDQNKPGLEFPTISERLAAAEIIDGLAFESLDHVCYIKKLMGREKDLKDILLIKAWQRKQK